MFIKKQNKTKKTTSVGLARVVFGLESLLHLYVIPHGETTNCTINYISTVAHRGHGNMQSSTATYKVPRQHTKFHGNIRSFTATYKVTRQNEKFSRGNIQNSIKCTDLYIEVSG